MLNIESCKERLEKTKQFAKEQGLLDQFEGQLKHLERFFDNEGQGSAICYLYNDHSPYSFYFEIERSGRIVCNGGLIYYEKNDSGVDAPQHSVRINTDHRGWQINT